MNIIRNIILLCKDIVNSNRVTVFFLLLAGYYIVNLITSPLNLGMSGGLEAEHNIYNQAISGVLIIYMFFFSAFSHFKHSYLIVNVICFFLFYIIINTYIRFSFDTSFHSVFELTEIAYLCYWGFGVIFCIKNFKYISVESLNRLIQLLVIVCLVFFSFRLFSQKTILNEYGVIAGVNAVAHAFMLIPLILLTFNGKKQIILFLICAFICIYSAKRQSVIGLAIMTFFSLGILSKTYFYKYKFVASILLIVFLYIGSNYVNLAFSDLNLRQERMQLEDNPEMDSGRIELWNAALRGFQQADDKTKWFGGGPNTAKKYIADYFISARAPHNGFIHILCDYGAIGLMFYLLFFLVQFRLVFKLRGLNNKLICLSICISWIFINIISHPGSLSFIFFAIGIGYIVRMQNYESVRRLS